MTDQSRSRGRRNIVRQSQRDPQSCVPQMLILRVPTHYPHSPFPCLPNLLHCTWTCLLLLLSATCLLGTSTPDPSKIRLSKCSSGSPSSVCESADDWCSSLADGTHADFLAKPPCSGFFRCSSGALVALNACPWGLFYEEASDTCVPLEHSSCSPPSSLSQGNQTSEQTPQWHQRRKLQHLLFQGVEVDYYQTHQGAGGAAAAEVKAGAGAGAADWTEINALLAFKNANVDPKGALASWQTPRQKLHAIGQRLVCTWYGVKCNNSTQGRIVTALLLSNEDAGSSKNKSLWGNLTIGQSIPPDFGNLTALQTLDLSYNFDRLSLSGGLVGPIPSELGRCSLLTSINLQFNNLNGSIPDSLSNLKHLRSLDLGQNLFSGPVPSSLGNISTLTFLNLEYNSLSGNLSDNLGGLVNLEDLSLSNNPDITGPIPSNLSRLHKLTSLKVLNVGLSGNFPSFWGSFPSLCYVRLSKTNLGGELNSSLGSIGTNPSCNPGVHIDLSYNKLSENLTSDLLNGLCGPHRASLPSLQYLILTGNSLSGPLPLNLNNCTALIKLDLSQNMISGPLPNGAFFEKVQLSFLILGSNNFNGSLPSSIWNSSSLVALDLSNNSLFGTIPPLNCSTATTLGSLDLHSNALSGDLPSALGGPFFTSCTYLQTLDLSSNLLTGSVPASLISLAGGLIGKGSVFLQKNKLTGSLPPLAPKENCSLLAFRVSENALTGSIPSSLGSCSMLSQLDLAQNQIQGPVPSALEALSSLVSLNLSSNHLQGDLPPSFFSNLTQLSLLDLSGNSLSGPLPPSLSRLALLASLNLSTNSFSGALPSSFTSLSLLSILDLSKNSFSSDIPQSLIPSNMPNLALLDLSSNQLSGPVPFGYANLSFLPSPTSSSSSPSPSSSSPSSSTPSAASFRLLLNFSSNNLSGRVPESLDAIPSAVANNPFLCGGAGYPDCQEEDSSSSSLSVGAIVGIALGAALVLVLMLAGTWWFLLPRDEWTGGTMLVFEKLDYPLTGKDLLDATDFFSEKHLLGAGGFGAVYKAKLQDGREIAIKRLKDDSTQGNKEFEAEITSLGNIRHRNLVTLVAAYVAAPPSRERVLCYDYMCGGSLDHILDGEMDDDSPFRKWEVRRNIALDVARGLQYLHHDCQPRIIHRDMKPANVLLDSQLVGHVADFGLARQSDASKSHMSTAVYGTVGYLAIEYVRDGRLSFKSDVFAYGVTLLQIITGRKPTDKEVSERGLSRWVGMQETDQVVDPRLNLNEDELEQVKGAIKLGLLCTSRVPVDRPNMSEVYHLLGHLEDFAAGLAAGPSMPRDSFRKADVGIRSA